MGDLHDLIQLTAKALHERAAYIVEHADNIPVRVRFEGRMRSFTLTEIPSLRILLAEAFRLLLSAPVPHRMVQPGESPAPAERAHTVEVELHGGIVHLPAEFREVARAANSKGLDGFEFVDADWGVDLEKAREAINGGGPVDELRSRFAMTFRKA